MQPVPLNLCVQLVDVVAHTQQKKLDFYIDLPAGQKSVESVVMFKHSKCSLYLNQAVHPVTDPVPAHDVFQGHFPLCNQHFRHIHLLPFSGSGTFTPKTQNGDSRYSPRSDKYPGRTHIPSRSSFSSFIRSTEYVHDHRHSSLLLPDKSYFYGGQSLSGNCVFSISHRSMA